MAEEKNATPEAELLALASVLKEHLRQWRRHGVWAVPAGRVPDEVRAAARSRGGGAAMAGAEGRDARRPARPPAVVDAKAAPSGRGAPSGWDAPGPPESIRIERAEAEPAERARADEAGIDPATIEALESGTLTGTVGLLRIKALLGKCRRCRLHRNRLHIVFGEGNPEADVVFVGEAPGRDEDRQGAPFVGKAGQLLTRMIEAMGLRRDEVYICNIIKCRPPENRDPEPDETETCRHFLQAQIRAIQPSIIVTLGRVAAQTLLASEAPVSRLRGRWHKFGDIALRCTYHPAYLLRTPEGKRPAWDDLQAVMAEMDRLKLLRRKTPSKRS